MTNTQIPPLFYRLDHIRAGILSTEWIKSPSIQLPSFLYHAALRRNDKNKTFPNTRHIYNYNTISSLKKVFHQRPQRSFKPDPMCQLKPIRRTTDVPTQYISTSPLFLQVNILPSPPEIHIPISDLFIPLALSFSHSSIPIQRHTAQQITS